MSRTDISGMTMRDPPEASFPRREFRRAKRPVYIGLLAGGVILLYPVATGATKILGPEFGVAPRIVLTLACLAIYAVGARALLSRWDFDEVVLAFDHQGIQFTPRGTGRIPWASIAGIKYHEVGRFRENKIIAISKRDAETKETRIDAHLLRGSRPRELYETMKRYHRHFAPATNSKDDANVGTYASSSWTGLDDD